MKAILKKIKTAAKHPGRILLYVMVNTSFGRLFSDKLYLKIVYRLKLDKKLNLKNPESFNEKLQWLKLYDRKDEYTRLVDKYEVRQYIAQRLGEEYLIPCLGVWDKFDDIDFESLPDRFVLKCTHDSGGLVICKDKSQLDMAAARKKINKSLKRQYYNVYREWPYKNVKPRIIAEEYMDNGDGELVDYKFMCFDGEPRYCFTCTERFAKDGVRITFFDEKWTKLPVSRVKHPTSEKDIPIPQMYDKMIEIAKDLSSGFPFLRVDLYELNGKIYFGELTFFPGSGLEGFEPAEWDYTIGQWLKIPVGKED